MLLVCQKSASVVDLHAAIATLGGHFYSLDSAVIIVDMFIEAALGWKRPAAVGAVGFLASNGRAWHALDVHCGVVAVGWCV